MKIFYVLYNFIEGLYVIFFYPKAVEISIVEKEPNWQPIFHDELKHQEKDFQKNLQKEISTKLGLMKQISNRTFFVKIIKEIKNKKGYYIRYAVY